MRTATDEQMTLDEQRFWLLMRLCEFVLRVRFNPAMVPGFYNGCIYDREDDRCSIDPDSSLHCCD